MKLFVAWFLLFLVSTTAQAGVNNPGSGSGSSGGTTGLAQLNLGTGDITAQSFINIFNSADITFSSGATPASLDQFGFPVNNFSGTIGGQIGPNSQTLSTTGPWTMAWDAGRSCFKMNFLAAANISNISSGVTVANGSGSGNPSITGNCGVAGSVTINWVSTSGLTYQWDGTYTSWASNTTGKFALYRQSDQTAYNAGTYWSPEMVSFIKTLNPESIRLMGWNVLNFNTWTNTANWKYRRTVSNFSFNNGADFPPGTRCGGSTSFCTISVSGGALTSAAAADTNLSGWTDGEQITGNVASGLTPVTVTGVASNGGNCQLTVSPSTTGMSPTAPIFVLFIGGATECNTQATTILTVDDATHVTINVVKTGSVYTSGGNIGFQTLAVTGKSGGAVLIADFIGAPIGTEDTFSSGNTSFTYNAVLNKVIYTNAGIGNSIPVEAQVQLAKLVNSNFWYNAPTFATADFVTNAGNLIYSTLSSPLKLIYERSNECWNGGQGCAGYMTQMGVELGITANSPLPFQSLRNLMDYKILAASNWSSAPTRLQMGYCFQAIFGGTSNATGPMQGSSLVSPGTAAYQAYVGGSAVNYNTSPNRPIDLMSALGSPGAVCYAPYVGGGTALSGQSPDIGNTAPTSFDTTLLTTIVSDWNASNTAGAIGLIDGSVRGDFGNRVQTVTASGTTFTTPLAHNFSQFDIVRFTVSGGTTYSGLNQLSTYQVLTVPTGSTFTAGQVVNGITGSAVNAGTVGSGTTSVGDISGGSSGNNNSANNSIFGTMSGSYTKYQDMAVNGFSPAPAVAPKVRWYEGNLEPSAPTTAQCTTLSINSTDCATIATAVDGWKNDPSAKATVEYYYKAFTGAFAGTITTGAMLNSISPSWLVLQGGGLYGLNSNSSYVSPSTRQTYNGFEAFSTGN